MRDAVLGPIEPLGARRLVHGEADGLPGLVVDRYGEHLVAQFLTFGMDRREKEVARALDQLVQPRGILARNDPKVREREGLVVETRLISGDVPRNLTMREGAVDLSVDPWSGQKTGAFIDQKSNHLRFGELARGRVLDAFCHDGGFGLQAAKKGASVIAVDSSAEACARAKVNARTNQVADRFEVVQANAFDFLTARAEARDSYDAIALDPPAFAKNRAAREAAARGYREINRRALSLLSPGGILVTASCSHHVGEEDFAAILAAASADAGKTVRVIERRGQPADHPGLLGMPESTYLKTLVCNALG
jgi:23S rRNA (cytosine1962-C5)-methyltransferase